MFCVKNVFRENIGSFVFMKPGIKHSFSLEKRYHEPLSVTTLPMRSMEWRDSIDSMEINGFPWISMEFMDSMESMDSMDSMHSMDVHGVH